MLDERGGIRSDLTIARLGADRFQVGANGNLDFDLLRAARPATTAASRSATSPPGRAASGCGARAPATCSPSLTDADVSNEAFRYFKGRELWVGNVPVTALRLSYVGELGWELYTTADMGRKLWDTLWAAGQAHGLIAAGRSAFGSLRLEKGYRSWGTDMTTEHDPVRGRPRLRGPDGQGRLRRPRRRSRGAARPTGGPSALVAARHRRSRGRGDGQGAGRGRRPAGRLRHERGVRLQRSTRPIAYAWLPAAAAPSRAGRSRSATSARTCPATVAAEPLFDPEMTRLRS